MERQALLEMSGCRVDTMWGCEWEAIKKKMAKSDSGHIEEKNEKTTYTHT